MVRQRHRLLSAAYRDLSPPVVRLGRGLIIFKATLVFAKLSTRVFVDNYKNRTN